MFVLTSNLPNAGPGALKNREDSKLYNTAKVCFFFLICHCSVIVSPSYAQESTLLQPAIDFYKKLATDCSRQQVSVDMWLFGSGYTDVATLSAFCCFTLETVACELTFVLTNNFRHAAQIHGWPDLLLQRLYCQQF